MRRALHTAFALLLGGLALAAAPDAQSQVYDTSTPRYAADLPVPSVHRYDQIYYLQPHNTFEHGSSLTGWLDLGYRTVELDVIDRDWTSNAQGPYVSHDWTPGHKNCSVAGNTRLGHCLGDIINWVAAHPENTTPILVFVDMKTTGSDLLSAWPAARVAALDEWIRSFVGTGLYKFSDLYSHVQAAHGGGGQPRALLAQHGWPLLSAMNGKIVVALTGGRLGFVNQGMDGALSQLVSNYGRYPATMLCPDVENDPGEVSVGGTLDGISTNNSQYFVCSNLKSQDHYELTANRAAQNKQMIHLWGDHVFGNTSFTYNYIAAAHGISAIGQDLADFSAATTFGGALPHVGVRRSLPGYFELAPLANGALCATVNGGYGNGTAVVSSTCAVTNQQQYVYTAEGQLRPKGNNVYCVDVSGGSASEGKNVHLWNCDGGSSEKWRIDPDGFFRNNTNTGQCLTAGGSSGAQFKNRACTTSNDRRFQLYAVPDWVPTSF